MDTKRLAFLKAVEADLTASRPSRSEDVVPVSAGRSKRIAGKMSAVAAVLFASASFFTLSAPGAGASVTADCMSPEFIPQNQTKHCSLLDIQNFTYLYTYSPNQAVACYVFDHYSFTCGNVWVYVGRDEACGQ